MDIDALPKVKKPTKAEQVAIDAEQAEMAERFPASGRQFNRAKAVLTELNAIPREDWGQRQFNSYVDALVEMGEFDVAYELTRDKKYKQIWDAINGKTKLCKCKDYESVELDKNNQPVTVRHSRLFVRSEMWNVKTGAMANIIMCNVCGRVTL